MMRKRWMIILLASIAVVTSSLACTASAWQGARGSGRVVERDFEVDDFTGVELATFADLYIEVGETEALRLEAEDNLINYFQAAVTGDTLEIRNRSGVNLRPTRPVRFYLTVTSLDTIVVSGSGDVETPDLWAERITVTITGSGDVDMGNLDADGVDVRVTGSGNLNVAGSEAQDQAITLNGSGDVRIEDMDAELIEVRITGSGNLDILSGETEAQNVTITGSGDYDARRMESVEAAMRVTGSGSMTIQVSERLGAMILGSGDVHYVGHPTVTQSVTGSGDVVQIGR
jgi:hypothetical protein